MLEKINLKKIDTLIKNKFPIIYNYNFNGLVLLYGGAVKDIITNNKVNDLDFVILSQGECQIKDFISKYKLKYTMNALGGYKINYKNIEVDICTTDDLLDVVTYDIDALFYDIESHNLIVCGPIHSYEDRIITEINDRMEFNSIRRLKKLKNHIKQITNSNKRVKVRQNIISIIYRRIKRGIKTKKR